MDDATLTAQKIWEFVKGPQWSRFLGGCLIFASYILIFFIVVLSLSAYQVQTRIHEHNKSNGSGNIWVLVKLASEHSGQSAQQRKQTLTSLIEQRAKVRVQATDVLAKIRVLKQKIATSVNTIKPNTLDAKDKTFSFLAGTQTVESSKLAKETTVDINQLRELAIDAVVLKEQGDIFENHIQVVRGNKVSDFVRGLMSEIGYFKFSGDWWAPRVLRSMFGNGDGSKFIFVTMPSEALVLMVVIAMGAMGSLIFVTQTFFSEDRREKANFYLFRPLFGSIVAIGVYVLTKAGVMVASAAQIQTDGTVHLNAFFVAFVSLIAGLMSESAIEAINRAGSSFLRGTREDMRERFMIGERVKKAMKKTEMTETDFVKLVERPQETVESWMNETTVVPVDAQIAISAKLGVPIRELFTDQAPKIEKK